MSTLVEIKEATTDGNKDKVAELVQQAIENEISALLTTTMSSMGATIEALEKAGLRQNVKVLIGGAPVSQKFADQIGADGYGETS